MNIRNHNQVIILYILLGLALVMGMNTGYNNNVDSLKKVISEKHGIKDTSILATINDLAWEYLSFAVYDSALFYSNGSVVFSKSY